MIRMKTMMGCLLIAGLLAANLTQASVRPLLTRVVAYAEDRETAVEVLNSSGEAYMVQSWLEDLHGRDSDLPLVLTPPVMKLAGKSQGKLRLVVMKGAIPQDRESAYWLSVQEIPPKAKNPADNRLLVAIRSRIKVFVRPEGLSSAGAREAAKQLTWSVEQDGGKRWLKATNPTPYHISFGELSVGNGAGKGVRLEDKNHMTPPKGSMRYLLPAAVKEGRLTVTWSAMLDWGGEGETIKAEIIP
ncbi:molecular chaperone [Citrobacter amalonaticus]|uniref:fimbrial biogenesis chaperone n=1 Tax=Citrobacter farmeri TaxID=67824 RepID=UPI0005A957E7|nr:molecular chaperone [Citrobacter farmeri]MDB2167006.1 molecular chaperone [Citrobacter farmeri]QXA99850.1 molecular chaperone [Citrobacter farmeri]